MHFASLIIKLFAKKGVMLPLLCVSLLFPSNASKRDIKEANENVPNSTITLPEGNNDIERFSNSLSNTQGIEGKLNLNLTLKDGGSAASNSYIKVEDAPLRFAKTSNKDFGLDLGMSINYNGVSKDAYVHYSSDVVYVDFEGLKYKYSDSTYKAVVSKIISIFGVDIIKVPDEFYNLFNFIGNSDSSINEEITLVEESSSASYGYRLTYSSYTLHLEADDSYNLTRVYANELTVNNATFSFDLSTLVNDDELTIIQGMVPSNSASYKEVYDSLDLVRKIKNLADSKRFGLILDGTLHHDIEATNHYDASEEDVKMDLNFFADIDSMNFSGNVSALPLDNQENKNEIAFLSKKEDEQKTYLNYNDVMKVAVTDLTLNELIARIKEDFGDSFDILDKLLSLLDEHFVSNIKAGRYEDLLGSLKSLSNEGNYVVATINLGGLGLGEESEIVLKIDTTNNDKLATITLNKVGLSGFFFNDTTIEIVQYEDRSFDVSNYYFLEKIPNIYEQIYDIYSSPKFHLSIEGSLKDENGVGIPSIKGEANLLGHSSDSSLYEFDGGYVDLELTQQIGVNNSDGTFNKLGDSKKHHVAVDLEKLETAYFHYYDTDRYAKDSKNNKGTMGKISVGPFQDVIDIIKEIYNSNDPRFSSWFKVVEGAASSNVMDALKTGKYSPLLGMNLIVSSNFTANSSTIVLSGKAFGLSTDTSDNNFSVTFTYENSVIKTLALNNLYVGGKTLDISITISDYIEDKLNVIDHSDSSITDYTGFSPLISDLYNTANMTTYHLTGTNIGINGTGIISMLKLVFDIDFKLYVKDSVVKAYGIFSEKLTAFNDGYSSIFRAKYRTVVLYYDCINHETGKTYPDNSGYLYGTWNIGSKDQISGGDSYGSFKYHSSYFSDTTNLVHFLFKDVIGLNDTIYNMIKGQITKEDTTGKAVNYEELIQNFSYDEQNRSWDLGISIQTLINNNALKDLKVTIKSSYSSANEAYVLSNMDLTMSVLGIMNIKGAIANTDLDQKDNWSAANDTYQSYIDAHRGDATTA